MYRTVLICFVLTTLCSILNVILHISTFRDETIVIGTVVSMNIYSFSELTKFRNNLAGVKLWLVYFALLINALILAIKVPKIAGGSYILASAGFMAFIIVVIVTLHHIAKKER